MTHHMEPIKVGHSFEETSTDRFFLIKVRWPELLKITYPGEIGFGNRQGHAETSTELWRSVTVRLEYLACHEPKKYIQTFLTFEQRLIKKIDMSQEPDQSLRDQYVVPEDPVLSRLVSEVALIDVVRALTYNNILFTIEQDPQKEKDHG